MNSTLTSPVDAFESINRGFNSVFQPNKLSLGLVIPIENHGDNPVPSMERHLERAQLAEELGFAALWLRDVPFNVPSFGDNGQNFDPFVYLGALAMQTDRIALGVSSIVLPLRHPAHVAKAAATADQLSNGRLILGVASGDRPDEYPAMNLNFENRGKRFRESFHYIRKLAQDSPNLDNDYGTFRSEMDLLPKPTAGKLPLLITGGSQQKPTWIAQNGDGWMVYPRNPTIQSQVINEWRSQVEANRLPAKPIMQPLYLDLADDPNAYPRPIHLGFHLGTKHLLKYLHTLHKLGMNHIALNLRFNRNNVETTLKKLANEILPEFHS
ncbi:MAG: LLM class oxidoreductase [Verrucomicrobiota bacterium]